eukprot:g45417.t1
MRTTGDLEYWVEQAKQRATVTNVSLPPVFFLHLRKAGGTSICKMARRSGLGANPDNNCNLPEQDRALFTGPPHSQLRIPALYKQWKFLASEDPLSDDPVSLPGFFTFTVLRDPIARAISSYHMRNKKLRRLNGVSVAKHVPRGKLNTTHLVEAKRRLHCFSLIWITEWFFILGDISHVLLGWSGEVR